VQAVLVDTSIWIRLFRGDPLVRSLPLLLRSSLAHVHPWSLAELELGTGVSRDYLQILAQAPRIAGVADEAALAFLRAHRLQQSGIGWVDLQLLAAAHGRGVALWTADEPLASAARRVHLPPLRPDSWR
jgi:predicted nucleic acid-binding protein